MEKTVEGCLEHLMERYPALSPCRAQILEAFACLCDCAYRGGTIFVCGNGGSAADAEHIVGELLKGFMKKRPLPAADQEALMALAGQDEGTYLAVRLQMGIRALALTSHVGLTTAVINDLGGDLVYAQQLNALARAGDVLWALSTSGNARNVRLACHVARLRGVRILGMTGDGGGHLAALADTCIRVPSSQTFEIQEYHLPIYHALCAMIESRFFED
jgi:D-sedoheptulose 7-phosphate isomerase